MDQVIFQVEKRKSIHLPFPSYDRAREDKVSQKNTPFNGPVSRLLWKKAHEVPSNYQDSFDYGVFDVLHRKFGSKQPRGSVVFKTTFKLVNYHSTCTRCHYAFELDTYGRGCTFNCTYCYAKDQLARFGYWNNPHPFPVDISEIRKIFATVFESDRSSEWRDILEERVPLRIGSMSEAFMWMDQKYRVTYELLKILKFYRYPYVIFTKSDLIAQDDYLDALDPSLGAVQFSFAGSDEKLNLAMEPGAPSLSRRFNALLRLSDRGIWTAIRLNPLFPTYPDGYYTDRSALKQRFQGTIPRLEIFNIEEAAYFLDRAKEARVNTVLVGFVRLKPPVINSISRIAGINFRTFFRPELVHGSGDKHYSDSEISFYYKKLQSLCAERDIRFSTCYIGNGIKDYFQYQKLWSNKGDCCDIRGNVERFQSSSQMVPWDVRGAMTHHKDLVLQGKSLDENESKKWSSVLHEL